MNKQLRKLYSKYVLGITPLKDLERDMNRINKEHCTDIDFEQVAKSHNITVRELVNNYDYYEPELNNY